MEKGWSLLFRSLEVLSFLSSSVHMTNTLSIRSHDPIPEQHRRHTFSFLPFTSRPLPFLSHYVPQQDGQAGLVSIMLPSITSEYASTKYEKAERGKERVYYKLGNEWGWVGSGPRTKTAIQILLVY